MKKIVLYILILFFSNGFAQIFTQKKLSPYSVFELTKTYKKKAIWFQEMPQYNQDSTVYYFDKASNLLLTNLPIQYEVLASIYLQKSNISVNNLAASTSDSLANISWIYYQKSKNKNYSLEYDLLTNWARIKLELGEQKKSLELFSKALVLFDNFKNPDLEAAVLLDKAIFYERYNLNEEQKLIFENLTKSHNYYKKIGIQKKPLEFFKVYKTYINYYEEKNIDSVYYYTYKMQSGLKYLKNPNLHAWHYVSLGRELITNPIPGKKTISKEQYEQGKQNIYKALQLLESYKIKSNTIIPYAHGLLADLNLQNKQYDAAIKNYRKSYEGYKLLKNKASTSNMLLYLGNAYEQKGNLLTALDYYKQHFEQTLIFQNEKNQRGLRESELQISLLRQDKKLSKKQKLQTIFTISLIIITLLLFVLHRINSVKQRRNKKLAVLNNDLENKNVLLDKRNAENELLLKEIHHRVKNNLEVVSSLLALQSAQIDDPNTKHAIFESQNRVNSIGIVHQKLYQGSNLGAIEMKDYFLNLSESILDSFGAEKRIDLQIAMENLDLDIDTAVPLGLIVNELLTNCIKYAFPNGQKGIITIKLHKQEINMLRLEVADNGIGKSGITYGTGFGGQLISLLTQQLNGTMTEQNQNGTTLIFDFKMKKAA